MIIFNLFENLFLSLYVGLFRGCTCFLSEANLHCKVCNEPTAVAETAAAAVASTLPTILNGM